MTKYKPLYALYKGLKEHGTDLPDSYGSFERSMTQAGNAGASNRRNFYQSLKDSNYDVPDTYEKFYESMFVPVNNTTSRARKIGETPMTEEDRKGFTLGAQDIRMNASKFVAGDALRYNKLKQNKQKQHKSFGRVNIGTNKTPYAPKDNVVKDEGLNTYVTSDNGETADLDNAQQKQAVLDVQNKLYMDALDKGEIPMASETIDKNGLYDLQENIGKDGTEVTEEGLQNQWNAKLDYAYKRRDELNKELDAIRQKEGNALLSYSATFGDTSSQISDDHRTLDAAKRKVEEEIRNLEALTGKESSTFWTTLGYVVNAIPILHNIKNGINYLFGSNTSRDMGKAVENSVGAAETWDFGLSSFDTYARLERIKAKVENKIPLTKAEQSFAQNMMAADKSAQLVNDNMGRAYRWTSVAGVSLPYMLDFFLTGGFSGMTKAAGKFAIKKAAQMELGTLGRTVTKYIGIGLGDVASSYAMAVTEQGLKTGADVMSRHLGSLYQDKDGNYAFGTFDENGNLLHEGGESFGKALYKGVTAAMLENYTEKMFTHWHLKRGAFKMMDYSPSLKKYADFFRHVGKSGWYGGSMNFMKKFGMGSYPEEVAEEIVNIPLNAALVGDNKFSELKDWKTWEDIVGSMAISVGSMAGMASAPHIVRGTVNQGVKAYDIAAFYVFKNRLNQADQRASEILGEDWARIKDRIDSAPNENLGTISADLHKQVAAGTFSEEQMDAAWAYIQNLRVMRGYNLAKTMEMQAKAMTGEENMPADIRQKQLNAAYAAGQETEGENKHLAQLEYEKQKFNLAKALGVSDSELEKMTDEQISYNLGMDDNLDNVIYNYQNAKAMYDGIVDNAQSAVDTAAKVASQRVDAMTNVEDGTIRQALIKGTNGMKDYPVYIISGNVETHDDGVINYTDSDNMIIIYNESTGRKETIPVSMLADVNPNIQNAEEVKAKAILEAKQKTITDLSNVVDGKLVKGSEFTMEDAQGNTHGYKIEDVDELGNCIVSMDGTLIPEPMPLDIIQQQYDQSNVARSVKNDQTAQEPEQTQQESQPIEDKFDYDKITNVNDGKVKSVVVTDEEGKNRFPNAKAVFLIQDKGAMPKFVVMDEEGNLTSYVGKRGDKIHPLNEMTVDEYKKQRQEGLQRIAAENANSSMIEDNSGTIEADRGEIEDAEPIGTGVFGNIYNQFKGKVKEAFNFLMHHKSGDLLGVFHRDDVGDIDLVWGDENMGLAHILGKHVGEGKDFETPDDAVSMIENVIDNGNIMQDTPNRYVITLDGFRVGIRKEFDGDKKNWIVTAIDYNRSKEEKGIVTNPTSASHGVEGSELAAPNDSNGKDINNSANGNENNESLTFEDGTPIPVDESGETDLSQTDAAHAAEWYDTNLGEDADDWLDGEIKKYKKLLEQAKNKKLTGNKPSELVASKKEKEAAIAKAQAVYNSAISIRDALKERRITKEENTPEGRKNLIEKARRKFARLKSAVNNDAEAVSQLYKDVVGSLLHRLYDGTGIDVTDTIPLTAEEYVASNLGAHSLNYEGTETSKGVKQETGLSREDFAKTQLLAADGKGTTIDDLVHSLWENRPSNLESLDTQDIRNALIGVLTSGFKASEARNYVENLRIAQTENFLEEQKKAAENAAFAEEHTTPAEQQTETAPESDEQIEEETTEEKPEVKAADSEKINEQTNENINAPEVPEVATDENPLGQQRDSAPFSPKDNTKVTNSSEERKAMVEKNIVRSEDVLDHSIGKKMRKSLSRIAKMMGADIVYLHSADSNGWYDEKTNTIYLALDSADVLGTQFVFGHEMTHEIKAKNPAAFEELKSLVKNMMGEDAFNTITDKAQQKYKKGGASYWNDRNAMEEEVVADQIGSWLQDANYAHTLMMKMSHPLLAKLHEIVNRIRIAFTGTEYSDNAKLVLRSIEQAYVKTANGEITNPETGEDVSFSLRQKPEPKKKGIGYKVFVLKDGKLYPPMVANPDGAATPVGVWLDADAAPIAGESKTGRPQVKQGGKGSQGGSGKLAYRPGWHLGVVSYAIQFNRKDADGNKTLFPKNFVFAEVEYAADVDYQEEARQEGINPSGKYQHSLAGLKHLPTDGYYMYRTNPNPETDPWVITGAMKVNRILTRAEQAELVKNAGREPQQIQEGDIVTDDVVNSINQEIAAAPKFSQKVYHGSGADFTEFDFDHMGEGAGSQVFGWGGYVTSSKKIGKSYATLMDNDPSKAYYRIQRSNGTRFAKKYPTLESFLHGDKQIAMNDKFTEQEKIDYYNEMKKLAEPYHNLYEVDIPDDNGSNYLDWDAPITDELIDKVAKALPSLRSYDIKDLKKDRTFDNFYKTISMRSVKDDASFNDDKAASKLLSSLGYTGIKYKAGRNFGGAEVGDTNYVIFKPEDMRITEHTKFSLKDNQGNPLNQDGTLKLDKIKSVDELTDEDFLHPTRNVELPKLPKKIADTIGTEGKPVVIKKNIFERNYMRHKDVTPELSKAIFKSALYNPDLYGQNQKKTRPYNWVLINTKDEKGNNRTVLLEVNPNKDNVEIVHWHFVNDKNLGLIKKQAIREGDQVLILPSEKSEEVGGLSNLTDDLSAAKIDNSSETAKENGEKVDGEGTKFSLKDEKIKSVAKKFGVNEDDVAMYANAVERGSTAEAARARANIKRHLLLANEDKISSFKELMKYTMPVNEALKENFGDLDAMIEERRKQVEAERNAMEAARKRAQEEEEKRQKHLDELSLIPTDELDKRYMDAIANNDESTAREMLDESARRNGYGDVDSDYQGQGAWAAPSNPQYESDEARRADIENSPDVNLEDIALGYNLQPDDYFDNPRAYMNNTAYGLESAHVIKNALDAIKNGEKDVKVKVYRAVPTSVKEGKLRNGDWVTPSKKYAEMHGDNRLDGKYRIIEDEVPANQLWWDGNDVNEFGFDDGKEYRYKNAKNNRKLNDLITYDNKGNVIPPSKRFNSRKSDIRFSLKAMMEKPEGWKQANKKAIHVAEAIERDPKFSLKNLDGTLIKAGTYFSGGGFVEEGLKGIIDPVVAVEYDEKISGVYRNNFGQHIVTADVRDVDPKELVKKIDGEVEYFHASPVCKNYSQAKSNHTEVELDKETAASTAEFINAVKPKVVTIENVKGYKDSEAMKTITDALDTNGYTWDADVYNAADYGGYTNRERLIVRAVRDGKLPEKPKKMAHKSGWYEAVADIIPTLTEKKNGVAPWMDVRLKADGIDWRNIDKPLYVMGSAYADGKVPHAFADELLPTLRTKSGDVIVMPDGKVYRAMGRVLARVSGVSDDYKMPFSENLSHTIIGNGIPTQLTEHVIAPLLQNTLRPTSPDEGSPKFSLRGSTPYDKQMEEWKEKNHLEKDAAPMEKPIKQDDENIFDYMNRMVEWTRNQNLWKTAPKQTGFQDALAKWKADNGLSPDAYPPVRPHREYYSSEIGYAEDLEEYNKKKELWKTAPKPKDFDLSIDLEDMNKQLRNIRRAVLNQKNYDQRTVKAVSDLVRKMLNIGWGDGLSRGKVGNLLSAAKNATGANDVKKYLDKAMGILAENYLNRLSTAYDNLIKTKGARSDQSGVIKMGSLDAKGQAFMSEYKKAINMDDKSLNDYIANIEEDSAKNENNVEMNDYRLAGIQAAIMFKQQIGGNDADIAELQRQIGELKNKKDATKEDKDLLKSLEKKLFENKFDRITMYENLLNNIQRMVKESKGRAKEFREEITEHKNEILHRANLDLEGVDSTYYDTTTAKKKLVNNDLQRAVFSSTYTFEQFLKFFGKKAANGEGYLYNYFTKLNQDALDEEQLYNEMNRNALDEKTKELFGKEKFMKLVGIDGKGMKEMDIEVTDYSNKKTGKRTIHLKQGQMLYIYLVNKETDGEMKLRAMGITEEDVAAIEENLDPRVKAMGEWLQDEYLPECQRRYQATHTKYFGAPMKEVENYFPLAINNRARNVKEDVNQDSDAMSQLAGTSTGAIVTRRVNVIPLDIENADAFEVAFNHLQDMEEWSAMLPFRQDINTLLSYTHFRNQGQNMSSVAYGSGKTLWDEFKQTAQIAAGTYKPKVNAGMMDSRIAAAMGGIAVAKISGRLWTAIKQSQSATVFLPECDFTRFVKNGVNPYGSWKWAMENIPDFRKRVENMTYGDVKLRQYLDELEKWHDWTKTISKIGMAPNILVDGITCAVGARSVYETEVNRLTKLGYPKEKAEEKAYYKAVAAYNKTQQSSGGMYLSPMQVDRTYVSAALSLFKNANYAYGRMQIEACRGLARTYDFWGGKHKTALIESMTRQIMEEDGLDENTARAIAKATYNRTFRQSIGRLINFATLVPISWALYKVLPYLLTGDDDDKKTDMIEEGVLKGFATSLSDNYVIPFASNILNAGLKVEDGKPTFDPEVFRYQNLYINPATSDLANIYSMIGNQKWYSVANKLGMLGVQSLIGFNPETVGALYQAFAEADYDNGNTAKEWQIGILKAISAPEESIRELYMDELGLKSGDKDAMKKFMSLAGLDADDIKKVPLSELEKRYAERQINRDNLLSQIGMDAETFNGYVDKYQKSFEKKIKDKMDKWDEYDKKKIDEFFDTTSDPKLKDMIAKKRAKDANAAADEQIAKEGLNQEKKGKEPSEEAYDAVKMSIDVAEDNAISTYNKVLNKRYAALNDEYNNQTDAMKYIFMSNHPNFKAYKDIESEYTNYGKKMKELKEKLVSADGYDAKQTILKQIRAERDKFYELQSKVR